MPTQRFLNVVFLCLCLLGALQSRASHIIGGEVRYEHISGNTYRVLLNLYGDCDLSPGSTYSTLETLRPKIRIYRDSTILVDSIVLARTANPPQDASPTCPAYLGNTRCNGGAEIGIKIFEYAATLTLPAASPYSSCWRFVMNGNYMDATGNTLAGRSAAIDNIQGATMMYIYSTLNNLGGRTNSSPAFSTVATPYFCMSGSETFNPGATDVNGDLLNYRVVTALQPDNFPVSYTPGFPAPYRLAANGTPTFNAQTGQLVFSPSRQQRSVVVYLTEEYRNGVRVGSILREMTFVVLACNNAAPQAALSNLRGGTLTGSNTITVCKGQTLSFNLNPTDAQNDTIDVTATGIPSGATYFITSNGSRTPTSSFSWNTGFANTGTYNFYVTYADRACPIAARQTIGYSIVVAPAPQFTFSNLSPAGCNRKGIFQINAPAGITQVLTIKQGAATVKSYPANTAPPITDSLAPGTYQITAISGNSCSKDTTITIAAPNVPVLIASQTPVSCFGRQDGTATVQVSGGTPPYTYSWNTTPVQNTPTISGLAAGTYTVQVTDATGCRQSASVAVLQPGLLQVQVQIQDVVCFGQANGTATAVVTGGTAPYVYSWNTTPPQTSATASGLPPGSYTVSVTDARGCTAQALDSVRTPQPLSATATAMTQNRCYGTAEGAATVVATGGVQPYRFSWNASPPQSTPTATGLPAGVFQALITDANGCTASDTVTITQGNAIAATFTVTDTPCANDATGRAYVQASGGAGGPYTYRWNRGTPLSSDTVSGLAPGMIQVAIADNNNCQQEFNAVIGTRPIPQISAGPDRILCNGDSLVLQTTGTATNWQWTPADDLSCTNCASPVTTTQVSRTYRVFTYFDNGCTAADTVAIQVLYRAGLSEVGRDTTICAGDTALLFAGGGSAYQWTPAPSLTNDTIDRPGAFPQATTVYTVIIQQNQCFADTLMQTVSVLPRPTVSLGPDFPALTGATVVLRAEVSGADAIAWTPAVGLSCTDCFNPSATLMQSTEYIATVRNELGCTASDTLRIRVGCDEGSYYVANTFTPNGDGIDDWFYPQGRGGGTITRFEVYSRWGEKVFVATNLTPNYPQGGWDGTYADQRLNAGVFTYVMEARCADGTPVYLKGDITLIR